MLFDHVAIGGGVIGFNVTFNIVNHIINSKNIHNKNFNIAIIDKKITNLYGGVAYNIEDSIFGYFNNPVRLSPDLFVFSFLVSRAHISYQRAKAKCPNNPALAASLCPRSTARRPHPPW